MKEKERGKYRPAEFARLGGVTVRALHHYDRLGLLRPHGRTAAGHRSYDDDDFAVLQQVVTLKFIGFPLKQIKRLLERKGAGLAAALDLQFQALQEKSCRLGWAILAIENARRILAAGAKPGPEPFQKILEGINMQTNTEWTKKYYSAEAQKAMAERGKQWTPELQAKAQKDWADLGREIESAATSGADPAGEIGQKLAARHSALIAGFTGGNPAVEEGLKKMYADRENWQAKFPRPYNSAGEQFIRKALEIFRSSQKTL